MRIFIADHQSKVRFALRMLLVRQPGLEVVGEAATVEDLLARASAAQPDLLLLHWRLGEEMPDLLGTLKGICPGLDVIVLSVRQEASNEALAAGAAAFICKMDPPDKLLAAIEAIRIKQGQDKDDGRGREGKKRAGSLRQPSTQGKRGERDGIERRGLGAGNPEPVPQPGV